jgi:hypothetical protein
MKETKEVKKAMAKGEGRKMYLRGRRNLDGSDGPVDTQLREKGWLTEEHSY